MSGTLICQLS